MTEFERGHGLPDPVFVLLPCQVDIGTGERRGFDEKGLIFRRHDEEIGPVLAPADLGLERDGCAKTTEGTVDFELRRAWRQSAVVTPRLRSRSTVSKVGSRAADSSRATRARNCGSAAAWNVNMLNSPGHQPLRSN
ncbi:hypothetical protein [Lentzea roselyniae]|uniref:hypothetical protein n=1 Tax=Lentzea roselyniae TaxID=531940 RepID=UPI0031F7B4BD